MIDRSIPVVGRSRPDVAGEIHDLALAAGYRPLSVALDRSSFARTVRPRWATVAGIVLAPTIVGLLVLLVRTTETFTAVVREDHTGIDARIHGRLDRALLDQITRACGASSSPGVSPYAPSGGVAVPPGAPIVLPSAAIVLPGPIATIGATAGAGGPAAATATTTSQSARPAGVAPPPTPPPYIAPAASAPPVAAPVSYPAAAPSSTSGPAAHVPDPTYASTPPPATAAVVTPAAASAGPPLAAPAAPNPWILGASVDASIEGATQVVSGAAFAVPSAAPARRPGKILTLRLEDGRSVEVSTTTLVGRNPTPGEHDVEPRLVAIPDDTVSKTHAAFGVTDDGIAWVSDRHSTNGSVLVDPDGREIPLEPGQRIRVDVGCAVRLGGVWTRIERFA